MKGRLAFAAIVFAVAAGLAYAQQAAQFIGPITPNNCAQWFAVGILKDAGVNCTTGGGGGATSGTVTSVGLALPNIFVVSGSPVTTAGTLTGTFANETANTALMGPVSGSPAAPTFRTISSADLPLPTSQAVGAIFAAGPVTSQYVFQIASTGIPGLRQPQFSELSGSLAPTQCPTATNSVQGCIQGVAPVASLWINSINAGVPQLSQPAFTDIAGAIAPGQLPTIGNNTVLSNITGSSNPPAGNSLSAVLDSALGSTAFSVIYRGPSTWTVLTPGVQGQFLATSGASNAPVWANAAGGGTLQSITPATSMFLSTNPCTVSCVVSVVSTANNTVFANTSGGSAPPSATSPSVVLDIFGSSQGSILTRGASIWTALTPGASGTVLQSNGAGATPSWAVTNLSRVTNSLGSNTNLTNVANYFDGPSTAQGTTGTWFASGTVTLNDTTGAAKFSCKLWDGTTVIAASVETSGGANFRVTMSLSGYLASPAANIKISCNDASSTSGAILFNDTGTSKDSTLSVLRVN